MNMIQMKEAANFKQLAVFLLLISEERTMNSYGNASFYNEPRQI